MDDVSTSAMADDKRMKLRYAGQCRLCAVELPSRADAIYERATKTVRCVECAVEPVEPVGAVGPIETGQAGASARRMYEQRRARDEERVRAKWGRLGGMAVAFSEERQSTTAWAKGAVGEEKLGVRLDQLASAEIAVLHDRRIPGSRANIDHVVVTSAGVWVIDAKKYKGRPVLKIEGGLLRPRTEKLKVGGRDQTKVVDGVLRQIELVREVVGEVPVRGSLCFVDADWPLIGGAFQTRGVQVLWPRRLAKLLAADRGSDVDVRQVAEQLAVWFKPA